MPRLPRLDFPGVPQHIVQRGNDRQACFAADIDYQRYRQDLADAARRFGCAIHAYVLMTNHFHLLVTPTAVGAASAMMQALGRRYVGYFNRTRTSITSVRRHSVSGFSLVRRLAGVQRTEDRIARWC